MKLDVTCMRYLGKDDYRMLQAVEMGMRNHELVPVELIASIAKLRHGGSHKILSTLLRYKLIAHENQKFNGYRLSYQGYDILALRTLLSRGVIQSVGSQIGIGKESDVFEAQDEHGNELVLKIHRLGRTSFRDVRSKRDYMVGRSKSSWLYMSRLAALKEFAFMQALYAHGFNTPIPIEHNRHIVAMSKVDGFPMAQLKAGSMEGAPEVFQASFEILTRLAQCGLVHCDFNEFNLMVSKSRVVTLIDFPQMVSTNHPNAEEMFQRDKNGLVKFFAMKMRYIPPEDAVNITLADFPVIEANIDMEVRAAGFTQEEDDDLVGFMTRNALERGEAAANGEDEEDRDQGSSDVSGEYDENENEGTDADADADADDGCGSGNKKQLGDGVAAAGVFDSIAAKASLELAEAATATGGAAEADDAGEDDDDVSDLGNEDPDDIDLVQKVQLLSGEELEKARKDAKFKITKKNGGRFTKGNSKQNMTKQVNKYGKKVKPEKIEDMY